MKEKKSFSSLAEDIINQNIETFVKEAHLPAAVTADPEVPDISNVVVPDDFVQALVENRQTFEVKKKPIKRIETKPEVIEEDVEVEEIDVEDFITEFKELLSKGYHILKEMCSTGMIGTGPGGKVKKKRKKYVLGRKSKKPHIGTANRKG